MSEWKFVKEEVASLDEYGRPLNEDGEQISPFDVPDGIVDEAIAFVTEFVDVLDKHGAHILGDSEHERVSLRLNRESAFTMSYGQLLPYVVETASVRPSRIVEVRLAYHRSMLFGKLVRVDGVESEQ